MSDSSNGDGVEDVHRKQSHGDDVHTDGSGHSTLTSIPATGNLIIIIICNFNSNKYKFFLVSSESEISKNEGGNASWSSMLPLSSLCPEVLAWLPKELAKEIHKVNNNLGRSKSTKTEKKVKIDKDISERDSSKFNCNQCAKSYFHKSDLVRHMKKDHESFSCENCEQSYSKLRDLRKHANQFCHFCMEHIGTQLKRHIKSAHEIKIDQDISEKDSKNKFNCNQCANSYFHKSDLLRHMKKNHESFCCENCEQSFSKLPDLRKHVNQFCHLCMEHIGTQLKRHIKSTHEDIKPCNFCGKSFVGIDALIRHIKLAHRSMQIYKDGKKIDCHQCSKFEVITQSSYPYFHKSELLRHMKEDHKIFSCELCKQSYSTLSDLKSHTNQFCHFCMEHIGTKLKRHIESAHQHTRYKCNICDQSFKYPGDVERHAKRHRYPKIHCTVCEIQFWTNQKLAIHEDTTIHRNNVIKRKKYTCTICGVSFLKRSDFKRHTKAKDPCSNRDYFPCDMCTKLFSSLLAMENHKETHSKPFLRCPTCKKKFSNKSELLKHKETHISMPCPKCGKCFSQKGNREKHIEQCHTGKRFPCDICNKTFVRKDVLLDHMKSLEHIEKCKKTE